MKATNNTKLIGLLVVLVAAFVGYTIYNVPEAESGHHHGHEHGDEHEHAEEHAEEHDTEHGKMDYAQATLQPGRVVELHTTKGQIDFVLFEEDTPKTSARIADLVQKGCYDGVKFPRVEPDFVIQTDACKKEEPEPMGLEIAEGLKFPKGAVGMARTSDPNSNTSVFFITSEPAPHLNYDYTSFGRVIRGMDVVKNIKVGDKIEKALVREANENDIKQFKTQLELESKRKTGGPEETL